MMDDVQYNCSIAKTNAIHFCQKDNVHKVWQISKMILQETVSISSQTFSECGHLQSTHIIILYKHSCLSNAWKYSCKSCFGSPFSTLITLFNLLVIQKVTLSRIFLVLGTWKVTKRQNWVSTDVPTLFFLGQKLFHVKHCVERHIVVMQYPLVQPRIWYFSLTTLP
jgi:hypothetical protein